MKAINNSQRDVFVTVLCGIYHDLVSAVTPQSEVKRDLGTIRDRASTEGLGFLTKTLPSLGKALDRSLASGNPLQFSSFNKKKGTQLPAFCWHLFKVLFDNEGIPRQAKPGGDSRCESVEVASQQPVGGNTNDPRREAMIAALKALRQICYLFYKLDIPYHESQNEKVLEDFSKTDRELPRIRPEMFEGPDRETLLHARRLIGRVLANADPLSGIPKHGPGAVATGESSPDKHTFKRIYTRLDRVYKVDNWFYLNETHLAEDFDSLQSLDRRKAGCAKVVLVPKDSRGPRLISCEPLEYQWIQQAQMSVLVDCIQSHKLTRGFVNFTDQTINQRLAREASLSQERATLDMKEASDRVSLGLVYSLFPKRWFEALYASRSSHTLLPNGTKVRMKKFAPMGSAVCFPVEALVFWALSVAALIVHGNVRPREAATSVYVYGDDIICNTEDHSIVIRSLERYGLLVNRDKCCTTGHFRESCGMDAFLGTSVTPLKLRKPWSSDPKPSNLVSWVAFCNAAFEAGLFVTAYTLESLLQYVYGGRIPVVSYRNPSVVSFVRPDRDTRPSSQPRVKYRYNKRLHRGEFQGYALRPTSVMTKDTGYNLLLRLLAEAERTTPPTVRAAFCGPDREGRFYKNLCELDRLKSRAPGPIRDQTGYFAIAHREKPTRAWTAAR